MEVRILHTLGDGKYYETFWDKPDITDDEIEVQASMTGICRSDIDMMFGQFGPLPINMQGHEGLGTVTKIGKNITDVAVGDFVATRGEPAFADYYNARQGSYVTVPSLEPKYIIEPVACGVNLVMQSIRELGERSGHDKSLLINGSGFLAWVAYNVLLFNHLEFNIDVVGSSNQNVWKDKLSEFSNKHYDAIIDLGGKINIFEDPVFKDNALIVMAAQRKVTTDFQALLWKSASMTFPSPRNPNFHRCMKDAVYWIENEYLNVDDFWSCGYNRDSYWQQAFKDAVARSPNYSRGYIYWNN